jgi:hypothetical protein
MTITPRMKLAAWTLGVIGSFGVATTVVGEWTGWKRPWVTPPELEVVEKVAGSSRDWAVEAYKRNLQQQQQYLDDRREQYQEQQHRLPPPQRRAMPRYLKERQQRLNRTRCEFENSLLPPDSPLRKRCL